MATTRKKMSNAKQVLRTRTHSTGGDGRAFCVRYRLKRLPKRGGEGMYAVVVPQRKLSAAEFLNVMMERNPGLSRTMAKLYLETIFNTLAEELRNGNTVTFGNFATFGVSIVGKVEEGQTHVNATHALRPWARFAQRFTDAVNDGAHLLPLEGLPTVFQPEEKVIATRDRLFLSGFFRSPDKATFTVERADGATVPCALVDDNTSSTRNECTRIDLLMAHPLAPQEPATLHIRYTDATHTEVRLHLPFTVEGVKA